MNKSKELSLSLERLKYIFKTGGCLGLGLGLGIPLSIAIADLVVYHELKYSLLPIGTAILGFTGLSIKSFIDKRNLSSKK